MNFQETLFILAQEAAGGAPQQPGGLQSMIPMLVLMFVMMYFVLIRPQRKQQKALEEMRSNIGIGDKVVTAGGIHGIVTGQSKTTVSVKVADGMSIKFDRGSIQTILSSKGNAPSEEELADDEEADGDSEAEESHSAVK